MSSFSCMCCNRPLSVRESILRGLGPVCASRQQGEIDSGEADKADLPFDADAMDIIVERRADGLHFNIFQVFKHHSPTGFEIAFAGSGPADFALNIMVLFTNYLNEPRDVQLWDGKKISRIAWGLHQRFKFQFIATMDRDGGTIKGDDIRRWVDAEIAASKLSLAA